MTQQEMQKPDRELLEKLSRFRRQIHQNPEVSGKEYETAKAVAEFLRSCKPDQLLEEVGGTGVVAVFDSGRKGPSVMFRAELDALPIREINDFEYRSRKDGVSHKCGHDGHATILLGFAGILENQRPESGKVILLFQPAEENGEGAKAVLEDERFTALAPDRIFAFHNLPGYPLHEIVYRKGSFTAAVKSLVIQLNGKTAHAAEPEHGINPALPIADLLHETDKISNNDPERDDFMLITPVHIEMGEIAYGISAGQGELHLTIRTWTEDQMEYLAKSILEIIDRVKQKYEIEIAHYWTHEFSANKNDDDSVDLIVKSAKQNDLHLTERNFPFKWGEDFGLFTQHYSGAMFGIGSGEDCPALHNPDYDFPEELFTSGINMFHQISRHLLK